MQSGVKPLGGQAPVKIYNAVYSSVQVYECMVRGIAVMRRRSDAYVNATQILKVAGIDKGRRTKILEKEVLPGKHEIVQGGYGKYQGTWIPLERGREIARQYGVEPLLAPLFDFTPHPQSLGGLPGGLAAVGPSRPLSASSFNGVASQGHANGLAPPPIMPGSALRLLNQGRAQGLFTPSMSTLALMPAVSRPGSQSDGSLPPGYPQSPPFLSAASVTPPPSSQGIKRNHSEMDDNYIRAPAPPNQPPPGLAAPADIQAANPSRSLSTTPYINGPDDHAPAKRPRTDVGSMLVPHGAQAPVAQTKRIPSSRGTSHSPNGTTHVEKHLATSDMHADAVPDVELQPLQPASRPLIVRGMDASAPLKDPRRVSLVTDIITADDPIIVLNGLRRDPSDDSPPSALDVDIIIDDQGHTALHLAASMARMETVQALLGCGADIHRGNYNGETPLMRACLSKHNHDHQTFCKLVELLHESIRTLDTANRTVLHHIVAMAGVKDRSAVARYYLDEVLMWIVKHQGGDFNPIIDRQDEHGDTALNIAARVGNRGLVRTLIAIGANRTLSNKLGLRPGDFGIETEDLGGTSRTEDLFHTLRSLPSVPLQKSQDVLTGMTNLVNSLNTDFIAELKSKQDSLDVTQAHLRAATRELAEQRKQIQQCQARCNECDQVSQRLRNLAKAIADEDKFDWSGQTKKDGRDTCDGATTELRQQEFVFPAMIAGAVPTPSHWDEPPPIPADDSPAALVRLRRLKRWHDRAQQLMDERLKTLQGVSLTKELQAKKLVSICSNVALDKVDDLLEDLLLSFESERQGVDVARAAGFLQKVRDGLV